MPQIVFSHANGYPSGAYLPLFEELAGKGLSNISAYDHRPLWADGPAPTFLSWRTYAKDLIQHVEGLPEPCWLLGHSMGAAAGVLANQQRPDLFSGLVLIDPVLPRTSVWLLARFMNLLRPNGTVMVQRALKRPEQFSSFEAAFDFYRSKKVFSGFSDDALHAYVNAAHSPEGAEGVTLRYSGAWEACVYRSVPSVAGALKSINKPCLIIAGSQSYVLNASTLKWIRRRNSDLDVQQIEGGHLVPLEAPARCADAIARYITVHSD